MVAKTWTGQLAAGLTRAGAYVGGSRAAAIDTSKKPAPTIALSREVGARATSVARELGERLGWSVYDHELLERLAQDLNTDVSRLEKVDEKRISWLQEFAESFAAVPYVENSSYATHLVSLLVSLAADGRCVIVGRGAAQALPTATTLRVRLIADLEDRIRVMAEKLGVACHEASRRLEALEMERNRFVQDLLNRDPASPHHYDLVLNTSRYSVEGAAGIICEALEQL